MFSISEHFTFKLINKTLKQNKCTNTHLNFKQLASFLTVYISDLLTFS